MLNYLRIKERGANKGWTDATFEQKMKDIGWTRGQAWCAYFVKHIGREFGLHIAGSATDWRAISPSVMQTVNQLKMHLTADATDLNPGSIVLWQTKSNPTTGHTGVLLERLDANTILTLEGNTDADGSREGDGIYIKKRKGKVCGFNFKGFAPASESEQLRVLLGGIKSMGN